MHPITTGQVVRLYGLTYDVTDDAILSAVVDAKKAGMATLTLLKWNLTDKNTISR